MHVKCKYLLYIYIHKLCVCVLVSYNCVWQESARCSANYKIKLSGAVVVSQSEVVEYCKPGGCVEHVYYVLKCIHYVKRDFWFANKATVLDLNRTISQACATESGKFINSTFSLCFLDIKTGHLLISALTQETTWRYQFYLIWNSCRF